MGLILVPERGLEPPRLATQRSEHCVYTISPLGRNQYYTKYSLIML